MHVRERQLALIHDNVSDVLFCLAVEPNDRFCFQYVNRVFLQATGLAELQVIGKDVREVIPEAAHELVLGKYREAIREHRTVRWEEISEYPAGKKYGEVSITPVFDSEGVCTHLIGAVHDVTEIRVANEKMRASEERYRAFFENSMDAILLTSPEGNIHAANPAACRMFEKTESEIIHGGRANLVDPTDQRLPGFLVARAGIGSVRAELTLLRGDGTSFPAELSSAVFQDSDGNLRTTMIIRDVTQRKEAEAALAESEHKYRELVEHANGIILRWNSEGRVTFLNEFGQRFFGYSMEEILGRHVIETIVPRTGTGGRDLGRLMAEICADPKAFEQNTNENVKRNGERVWIAWTNRIVWDAEGKMMEILSIGTDVTERILAQKELQRNAQEHAAELEQRVVERTQELKIALRRAESADRLKSAFLAAMSHELRTPLNSIIGFTGILLQDLAGPLNAEQHKQLGMVQNSAHHLLALINDVLDLSKIEAGELKVNFARFDLRKMIERTVATLLPFARSKGLTLQAELAPEIGMAVSDARRVEQILLNLLNNAIKFTEHGSVVLNASAGDTHIQLRVTDTGIGIKPEEMDNLFKPFRQLDTGLSRNHEGTGLGLAICLRLAKLLGGKVEAESQWEIGSTFTVTLPMDPDRGENTGRSV